MIANKTFSDLMELMVDGVKKATIYASEKEVAKVTLHGSPDKRSLVKHFVLTVGRPNFHERFVIKKHKKAKDLFYPMVEVKLFPKKKK
jgi:hypothetical protein